MGDRVEREMGTLLDCKTESRRVYERGSALIELKPEIIN
jgi:hypothetical protein